MGRLQIPGLSYVGPQPQRPAVAVTRDVCPILSCLSGLSDFCFVLLGLRSRRGSFFGKTLRRNEGFVDGLGFRVQGSGFRFRVKGLGFRV